MRIVIAGDDVSIKDGVQLPRDRVPLGYIHKISVGVMAVEFQEGGRAGSIIDRPPPHIGYIVECAVQQDRFGMWVVFPLIVGQSGYHCPLADATERAVDKDVTMIFLCVPYPHKRSSAGECAMVEERGSSAEHSIPLAIDYTI